MRPRPKRGSSPARAVALGVGIALALGGWALSAAERGAAEVSERAAQEILQAAERWRTENESGCPTVTVLKSERRLPKDALADDGWGEHFRVQCTPAGITVRSAGKDGKLHTADDISLASSPS